MMNDLTIDNHKSDQIANLQSLMDQVDFTPKPSALAIAQSNSTHTPEPLDKPSVQEMTYPCWALGEKLGSMANAIHEEVKAPLGICGQSILMTAALVAQGFKNVEVDGRKIPLSLFALSIGQSGERKSVVDRIAFAPIEDWEREQQKKYATQKDNFRMASEAYRLAENNMKKRLKAEENPKLIQKELSELGEPPKQPRAPKCRVVDATVEGLQKHLRSALPVTGIYSDEGGIFFNGHSMSAEKATRTISLLSTLWDGSPIDMVRSSNETGAFTLYDRRLSIHLMIQPVIARRVFSDPLLVQQGFIPRFLIAEPRSTMGSRFYKEGDIRKRVEFKRYFTSLKNILDAGFHMREDGSLDLLPLRISANAKADWVQFHDEVEAQLSRDGELHHISGTAAKIAEQALRIAGVLTVINSENKAQCIQLKEMASGIALARYSLNQFLCMVEKSHVDEVADDARTLLNWIAKNRFEYLYPSLDANKRPNRLRPKETYAKAVELLSNHGYLKLIGRMQIQGTNRKQVYEVLHYSEPQI